MGGTPVRPEHPTDRPVAASGRKSYSLAQRRKEEFMNRWLKTPEGLSF